MSHKKAQVTLWAIGAVLVIFLIGSMAYGFALSGGSVDSLTPVSSGCKPKDINIRIKGEVGIKDAANIGVKAQADSLIVSEVRDLATSLKLSAIPLRAFSNQDYTWRVDLVNT